MILTRIPDIFSLYNLIRADDSSALLITSHFTQILSSVLANSMPRDLQEIIFTLISVRDAAPFRDIQLSSVLGNIVFDKNQRLFRLTRLRKSPRETLHLLSRTVHAIKYFTTLFPKFFALLHKDFENTELNDAETHRLQRGLWRFEVCSALVSAWESAGDLNVVQSGADTRVPRLIRYLGRLLPWELEEIACVYEFLESAATQSDLTRPLLAMETSNTATNRDSAMALGSGKEAKFLNQHGTTDVMDQLRHSNRVWVAGTVGIHAPLDSGSTIKLKEATRVRILSQGLVFLRGFQQIPLALKSAIETRLEGCCLGDEFFYAALYSLMNWQDRFPLVKEQQLHASHSFWNETDDYKHDKSFIN